MTPVFRAKNPSARLSLDCGRPGLWWGCWRKLPFENYFDHAAAGNAGNWNLAMGRSNRILINPDQANAVVGGNRPQVLFSLVTCCNHKTSSLKQVSTMRNAFIVLVVRMSKFV